jgi:hypothetical protein
MARVASGAGQRSAGLAAHGVPMAMASGVWCYGAGERQSHRQGPLKMPNNNNNNNKNDGPRRIVFREASELTNPKSQIFFDFFLVRSFGRSLVRGVHVQKHH